jgi:hypothetical protein
VKLRAPFPWFGGKSRAAHLVWPRFGDVPNYVEPFAGSLAIPLARPAEWPARVETVNDIDAYLANFWRAVQADPDEVAKHADWPVNEADLHARHRWLVESARDRVERVIADPEFYDAKVAGWWVWGQCLWIGSGWCARPEWSGRRSRGRAARGVHTDSHKQRPDLTNNGRGALAPEYSRMGDVVNQRRRPQLTAEMGVHCHGKLPQFDRGGRGIAGPSIEREFGGAASWKKRPDMRRGLKGVHAHGRRPQGGGRGGGSGLHAPTLTSQQVPDLSGSRGATGRGVHACGLELRSGGLFVYMRELAARLRRVRVCCGDWKRVVTPAVTTYIGLTAVFLDPPYQQDLRSICYSHDNDVSAEVRAWAIEHGCDPKLRIALCGYEGEHDMPATWSCVPWKAGGGYGRSVRGKANRHRERIWFSPHCLKQDATLLSLSEATA